MSDDLYLYRSDGPTATKVRGMLVNPTTHPAGILCMALAREIDQLREYVAGLDQRLTDHEDQ